MSGNEDPRADANTTAPRSIRRQLLLALLGSVALLWLLLAAIGLYGVYDDAESLGDAQLDQAARLLLAVVTHELEERLVGYRGEDAEEEGDHPMVPDIFAATGMSDDRPPAYIARLASGRVLLHSEDAGPLLDIQPDEGFVDYDSGNASWRILSLTNGLLGLTISVAQTRLHRDELVGALALRYLAPLLIALPLLALIIHVSVQRGLSSLRQLAEQVQKRSTADPRPLTDETVPVEALPLTEALDDLLGRLRQVREREQRFIADAAHELRTPLAGIKTQAQVAQLAAGEAQRDAALRSLIDGVDGGTRVISQLLTLARLDPARGDSGMAPSLLLPAVELVVTELATVAGKHQIELIVCGERSCAVPLDEMLLRILVRNLVENAIHFSPPGQPVSIEVDCDAKPATLTVRDRGPGIDSDQQQRVFERFYRGPGDGAPRAGLGLSIVRRIAEVADADLQLHNHPDGGLQVWVVF